MTVNGIGYGAISSYLGAYGSKSTEGSISEKVAAHIAEMDADGDGQLTVEESQVSAELFNEADTDGDGYVTEEELLAMMQKVRPEGPPPEGEMGETSEVSKEDMVAQIIADHDADGDGALSLEDGEIEERIFNSADADGDGVVTAEELLAALENGRPEGTPPETGEGMGPPSEAGAGEMASQVISELDSDEDGGLSSSETSASEEVFDAMDTNEDGVVSQSELEAAMATMLGSVQLSGLQSVNAAGGMAAYQQEMDRLILSALTGGESGLDSAGILSDTGATGTISLTA